MQQILKGLRILEGSAFVAAPSGGMTLAQLGADVIRFDQVGGGIDYRRWPVTEQGKSLYWNSLNKGKRSIAINFRSEAGRELIQSLITASGEDGGLFISNFPAKGWLADELLRSRRSDLIYINLVGDRHGGSAVDYTVNSRIGLPYLTGDRDTPVNNPFPVWDVLAGQQIAIALLVAERHRRLTGKGQFVKLALSDVAMATMGHLGYIAEAEINQEFRQPMGNHIFGTFGHDFECKDGYRVMVVGISSNQWDAIVKVTNTEPKIKAMEQDLKLDFFKEGDRFQAREQLRELFASWFKGKYYSDAKQALDEAGVCWGPYQTIEEFVNNDEDRLDANPLFTRIDQPGIGSYLVPSQAIQFTGLETQPPRPAPILGQHTDEILTEILAMDSSQIGKLHDDRVVAGPES